MGSLDPRVNRSITEDPGVEQLAENDCFATYEVFTQKKTGAQHVHVGIVHAPNAELAIVFAKEQYARRDKCTGIWVVKSSDITSTRHEDMDMFESATSAEKKYRDPGGFKVKDKIAAFKKENQQ